MFSFDRGKKVVDVQSHVRRLLDLTVPTLTYGLSEIRGEDRSNRTIPALLCAWEKDRPLLESHLYVVTRDLSSHGMSLVMQQPFRAEEVLIAICLDSEVMAEPWYFLGMSRGLRRIGGGFWTIGVELTEVVTHSHRHKLTALKGLVEQLRPAELVEA